MLAGIELADWNTEDELCRRKIWAFMHFMLHTCYKHFMLHCNIRVSCVLICVCVSLCLLFSVCGAVCVCVCVCVRVRVRARVRVQVCVFVYMTPAVFVLMSSSTGLWVNS